jgi:hypothetical protein
MTCGAEMDDVDLEAMLVCQQWAEALPSAFPLNITAHGSNDCSTTSTEEIVASPDLGNATIQAPRKSSIVTSGTRLWVRLANHAAAFFPLCLTAIAATWTWLQPAGAATMVLPILITTVVMGAAAWLAYPQQERQVKSAERQEKIAEQQVGVARQQLHEQELANRLKIKEICRSEAPTETDRASCEKALLSFAGSQSVITTDKIAGHTAEQMADTARENNEQQRRSIELSEPSVATQRDIPLSIASGDAPFRISNPFNPVAGMDSQHVVARIPQEGAVKKCLSRDLITSDDYQFDQQEETCRGPDNGHPFLVLDATIFEDRAISQSDVHWDFLAASILGAVYTSVDALPLAMIGLLAVSAPDMALSTNKHIKDKPKSWSTRRVLQIIILIYIACSLLENQSNAHLQYRPSALKAVPSQIAPPQAAAAEPIPARVWRASQAPISRGRNGKVPSSPAITRWLATPIHKDAVTPSKLTGCSQRLWVDGHKRELGKLNADLSQLLNEIEGEHAVDSVSRVIKIMATAQELRADLLKFWLESGLYDTGGPIQSGDY